MNILLRRTLKRTRPAAFAWLLWAVGLAFVLSAPHFNYMASVWRWLELIVPGTYVAWVASAWIELGQGKGLEEVDLVTDTRRWILPVLARGLGFWAVLALAEVVAGSHDLQWFLFAPLMLTLIVGAGMALAQQCLPVLPTVVLCLVPLFVADWHATLPSLAILTYVLARRCRWRGSLPTTLGVLALGAVLSGAGLWLLLLTCLPLLCGEAAFRTADEVIKARGNGFWTDISATPLGQSLFCRRISATTALSLLPASVALAGLFALALIGHPQSAVSCGMWTSCMCDAPHPDRDEWAGNLAWLAGAVALVTPLAANRLGLLVGVVTRGRSQALLLITAIGLSALALSGGSCILPLISEEGGPGPFYHDWLQRMLGLSVMAALLSDCLRVRNWRPLATDGLLPWLPVWLCLAQTSLHIHELCSQMSLVVVPQDVVFILLWISAAAQGLLGSLLYLCLRPRCTVMVAAYGLVAGFWAERCLALNILVDAPGPSYLPVIGLALALFCHKR